MADWQGKKIKSQATLGERLVRLRQEKGLSIKEVAEALGIQANYLDYLEKGEYDKLPGEVYVKSFLKKYAEFLKINPEMVMVLYRQEKKIVEKVTKKPQKQEVPKTVITPKTIRLFLIGLGIFAILLYLVGQIEQIFTPPQLELYSPQDNITVEDSFITVSGKTEPEVDIYINGQTILADPEGNFSKEVDLQEGVNIIQISVAKERSRENVLERKVLYKKDGNNN